MSAPQVRLVRLMGGRFWRVAISGDVYRQEFTLTSAQFYALRDHLTTYFPTPSPPPPVFGEGVTDFTE